MLAIVLSSSPALSARKLQGVQSRLDGHTMAEDKLKLTTEDKRYL
jgi:hypothetical protein